MHSFFSSIYSLPASFMEDKNMFGSFGRGRQLLSSGYSSDRAGSRSILKTPREFEASAPRRLSFMGSSQGRGRSVHREMGDLDGPYDLMIICVVVRKIMMI